MEVRKAIYSKPILEPANVLRCSKNCKPEFPQLTYHVHRLWHMREEVSNPPVLLNVVLGVGLQGMNHVRELDAIPDEEDWHVVAHQIPVTLPGVELDRKPTRVT